MSNSQLFMPFLGVIGCLIAGLICYLATLCYIRISFKIGLLDKPTGRKIHAHPTPYLGGAGIFTAFWAVVGVGMLLSRWVASHPHAATPPHLRVLMLNIAPLTREIGVIFIGALIIFILGLLDDIFDLSPVIKLAGQTVSAILLLSMGYTINFVNELGVLGYVITLAWILLVINAFNFIDSIDGHCAGIALISCVTFTAVSFVLNQPMIAIFSLVMAGALTGFLPHNFKPAKIFLGDNGSLFIGYLLAAITLLCTYKVPQNSLVTRFIPLLMFGVPIYDTISVITVRLLRGIAPWKGDRNHFAHRLCRMGMSEKAAVVFSYFVATTLGFLAVLSTQINTFLGAIILLMLFGSIITIIAFLEYYSSLRAHIIESLQKQHRRRRDDIRNEEDLRF